MAKVKYCNWKQDEEDNYETDCGDDEIFSITDGTPKQNKMKYCPYCGKIINILVKEMIG